MDIGTAKPTMLERRGIPHHLVDVVEPSEEFSVAEFRRIGRAVMKGSDRPVIICGGSGLHFRALVDPMSFAPTRDDLRAELEAASLDDLVARLTEADPGAADHVDLSNKRRVVRAVEIMQLTGETPSARAESAESKALRRYVPEVEFTAVGVDPGELLDERIDRRLGEMRAGGLVDEVARLKGDLGRTARSAVGYRELIRYLDGEVSEDDAFADISRKTKRLAKKQRTWFQRDPRIHWIPWFEHESDRVARAMEVLN